MMENRPSVAKLRLLMLSGLLGSICMAASDWLMIWGDTTFEGKLAWLTLGTAQIDPGRNALALALAFPAVLLYCAALFGVRHFLTDAPSRRVYTALTAVGMLPWLSLHLFYVMIFYLFGWMNRAGEPALALAACEALFGQFSWLIPVSEVLMLLPFLYLLGAVFWRRSVFPRAMALNNPLLLFVAFKVICGLLPDVPFRLAFLNGLMSESMAVWFIVFLAAMSRAAVRR